MESKPRILVVGDPMVDVYYIGSATRISPEAPIPVVKVTDVQQLPGGADNVVTNLRVLGAEVRFPRTPPADHCPVKSRLMVGDVQLARWDVCDDVAPLDLELLDQAVLHWHPDAIVVSDYGKGAITPEVIEWITELPVGVFVDTKRNPQEFSPSWTFFPNRTEFAQFEAEYRKLPNVIYKRSAEGVQHLHRGKIVAEFPAYAKQVASVCGAGDVVLANYVYATVTGRPDALFRASIAAAIAVERSRTAVVEGKDIDARIKELAVV